MRGRLYVVNILRKNSRLDVLKKAVSRVGVKTWNEIPHDFKNLSKKSSKQELKKALLEILKIEDSYVEINEIAMELKYYKINKIQNTPFSSFSFLVNFFIPQIYVLTYFMFFHFSYHKNVYNVI